VNTVTVKQLPQPVTRHVFCDLKKGTLFRALQPCNPENVYMKLDYDSRAVMLRDGNTYEFKPNSWVDPLKANEMVELLTY
jgi:hypothetical protein